MVYLNISPIQRIAIIICLLVPSYVSISLGGCSILLLHQADEYRKSKSIKQTALQSSAPAPK